MFSVLQNTLGTNHLPPILLSLPVPQYQSGQPEEGVRVPNLSIHQGFKMNNTPYHHLENPDRGK
jgi:hypothetical protein